MTNNSEEQDRSKGLRVLDEFPAGISPGIFIEFLSPIGKRLPFAPAKWIKPNGDNIEIRLRFAKYTYPDGKQICLYCLPEAIDQTLRIEDIESPLKTIGFLVIVGIENLQQLNRRVAEEDSAIHLAKSYRLPIIIAVINARMIERDTEKLSQLIDYSPDMPVVWCDGDIDLDFVQEVMDAIYSYI